MKVLPPDLPPTIFKISMDEIKALQRCADLTSVVKLVDIFKEKEFMYYLV